MDYLHRSQADLPASLWQTIDEAAVKAARDKLTGRRFLDLQGPFGPGLTSIEVGNDDYCRQPAEDEAGAVMGRAISVPMLRKSFRLSIRRVAGHLENGQPLDLKPAEDAAEAVARREEDFIYLGPPHRQLPRLLTHAGPIPIDGASCSRVIHALADV